MAHPSINTEVLLVTALNAVEQGVYVTHVEDLLGTWMGHTVYFFRDSQGYSGYAAIVNGRLHSADDLDGVLDLLLHLADKPTHRPDCDHNWGPLR